MAGKIVGLLQFPGQAVQGKQDGGELFLEKAAGVVEKDAPVFPVKQQNAQLRLQTLDGLGEGRLGNVELLRSVGNVLVPGGHHKIAKLQQFHRFPPECDSACGSAGNGL